jgi:hypothetical protein
VFKNSKSEFETNSEVENPVKFETRRDEELLEAFLDFDFSTDAKRPSVLSKFLDEYGLTLPRARKLQRALHDDIACILTGCRYQPVIETRHGPQLSGVASGNELLKKIEGLTEKPLWEYSEADRTVSMLPIMGRRPEQRLYQIVLDLLLSKRFWRMAVCKFCGKIFFGTKYCTNECLQAWHNKYTRAPAVKKKRQREKEQGTKAKKRRRKKRRKSYFAGGAKIFDQYKFLACLKRLNQEQSERLRWLQERITRPVKINLSYDHLPKQDRKQFDRIAEYS